MQAAKKSFIVTTLFALATLAHANPLHPITADSSQLNWVDMPSLPGAKYAVLTGDPKKHEFFVTRIKFPENYSVAPHSHSINEFETVVAGTYYLGTGSKVDTAKAVALGTGTSIEIPAKAVHYGWTKEETVLQISGIGPWGASYLKATPKFN